MKRLSLLFFAVFGFALLVTAAPKTPVNKLDPTRAYLDIKSNIEGAEVVIDNKTVGTTPLKEMVIVDGGKHTVKVRKKGFSDFADVVVAPLGKPTIVNAELLAVAGYMRVTTEDKEKAQVYLNGKFLGDTPYEGEIPIGQHELEVRRLGYFDFRSKFSSTGGKEFPFQAPLQKLPSDLNPLEKKKTIDALPFFSTNLGKIVFFSAGFIVLGGGSFGGLKIRAVSKNCSSDFLDVNCRNEGIDNTPGKR
jgi:hypothetical protein